ncbi:MAG TPA: GerMN domain-containing protein [Clostridiales bacterium]|nr:GerMN domain-containing protein [Clostridiales bacterium]
MKTIAVYVLLASCILVFMSGCARKVEPPEGVREPQQNTQQYSQRQEMADTQKISVVLYYTNNDMNKLVTETRDIIIETEENRALATLSLLFEGPLHDEFVHTIPKGTKILNFTQAENIATVNLSKEFLEASAMEQAVARLSIVNTLTEFEDIKHVKFYVNGDELKNEKGQPLGLLTRGSTDVLMEIAQQEQMPVQVEEDGTTVEKRKVILYFPDEQFMYVVPEVREVEVINKEIAQALVKELMAGPQKPGLVGIIPDEVKLLDVSVSDGIARLNFSKELKDNFPKGTAGESMFLGSITNTLTEVGTIDGVQFLIEGKEMEGVGHVEMDKPFERNTRIIGKRIVLYFSDEQGSQIVPEYRAIPQNELGVARKILEGLIEGPAKEGLKPVMPRGITKNDLLDVWIKDETAYVDFSANIKGKHAGGSAGEAITIYSIVNSLTELKNVKRVQFLIEGSKEEELTGHAIFSEPFMRNPGVIKNNNG